MFQCKSECTINGSIHLHLFGHCGRNIVINSDGSEAVRAQGEADDADFGNVWSESFTNQHSLPGAMCPSPVNVPKEARNLKEYIVVLTQD